MCVANECVLGSKMNRVLIGYVDNEFNEIFDKCRGDDCDVV